MPNAVKLSRAKVVPELPAVLRSNKGEPFPADLTGAEIVAIGTLSTDGVEGGGLVIDYRCPGDRAIRRIVFGLNELGMWVEYQGPSNAVALAR